MCRASLCCLPLFPGGKGNRTESTVFLYWKFSESISEGSCFPDYLEVATAVVVPRVVGKTSPHTSIYSVDIFHILVLQEYWVLAEMQNTALNAGARGRENCCTFH